MKALRTTIKIVRPGKRNSASAAPMGRPMMLAITTALMLTLSDNSTTSDRSRSRWTTRAKAVDMAAPKSVMPLY